MSMSTVGSSVAATSVPSDAVFAVSDESVVLDLLRRIHLSALPTETKNELRDILFTARTEGRVVLADDEYAAFLAAGIISAAVDAPVDVLPTEVAASTPPPTPHVTATAVSPSTSWSMRTRPTFGVQQPVSTSSVTRESEVTSLPLASEMLTASIEPVVDVLHAGAIPEVIPEVVEPDVQSVEEPVALEPDDVPPHAPEAPEVSTVPEPVPLAAKEPLSSFTSSSDATARINAIKREVNALVGNPVNLIDVNNDVGREYMNALLDAMKKTSAGVAEQEVARAMSRLEQAFISVKATVENKDNVPPIQTTETPVTSSDPIIEVGTGEPATATPHESEPIASSGWGSVAATMSTDVPLVKTLKVTSVAEAGEESTSSSEPVSMAPVTTTPEPRPSAPVTPSAAPVGDDTSVAITAVAKEKQIDVLMAAQKEEQMAVLRQRQAEAIADPFMAEEVTQGLRQLLSEWKLFKSSGLFGTGPGGDEHPLYKKLAPLTMAVVLAGRFEGATAEIRQNIAEYMNGWRYEEGITHELGETFEHYLRRVIRHILDQKAKPLDVV